MISNKVAPANILALYTWGLLEANLSLPRINGLIPIAPIDDEPRFHDADSAYLIYGYAEQHQGQGLREMRRGVFSLRVCARTASELGEISTTISRAFEGGDTPASHVNAWSSQAHNGVFVGIRFTSLDTIYVEGGEGTETEGGPVYGVINIAYRYISLQQVKQFNPSTAVWEYID